MNSDVHRSRQVISRRRALSIGGSVGLAGLLAACGRDGSTTAASAAPSAAGSAASPAASPAGASGVLGLLDKAPTCALTAEQTQGPYWFDVDSIRGDLREDRPGTTLSLALRVQDVSGCGAGGTATPLQYAVVEIWHCDAGGAYSGFESSSGGGPGPGGGGGTSNGSYSAGDQEATPQDDGTYLRGAQPTDADGIARFTTIYPGWYRGRTVHIHLKVHVDKKTVLTSQLYMEEAASDAVFTKAPYTDRGPRDTTNDADSIYDPSGLLALSRSGDGYLGVINLGVDL